LWAVPVSAPLPGLVVAVEVRAQLFSIECDLVCEIHGACRHCR